jgi:hypothetical protein
MGQLMTDDRLRDTTAPVTAEGLRERIAETLRKAFDYQIVAEWICCEPVNPDHEMCARAGVTRRQVAALLSDDPEFEPSEILDALVAALAGDPGDLPARMAAELTRHYVIDREASTCGCGETVTDWVDHIVAAAVSVRWEDHAATLARLAHAEARAEHAEGELSSRIEQHQRAVNRATAAERERDEAREERDAVRLVSKGRTMEQYDLEAEAERYAPEPAELRTAMVGDYRQEVEKIQAERDAMPKDERIRREALDAPLLRIQLAHFVGWKRRADAAEAERDALKAAIAEAVKLINEWMTPGNSLFDPSHAAQVEALLKKTIGERTIAALAPTENRT